MRRKPRLTNPAADGGRGGRAALRRAGVTLIELLVAVAILSLLATILLPKMLDGIQKGRQKRTMADIRTTGTALMAWLTDQMSAAAAGGSRVDLSKLHQIPHTELQEILVPTYMQKVPFEDAWGHPYDYYLDFNFVGANGQDATMAIRSPGRNGLPDAVVYNWGPFSPTDYDQDIVWKDGFLVRWPGSEFFSGCNQGVGNGAEGCDPGNSNNRLPSNDEPTSPPGTPGDPGRKGGAS